MCVSRVADYDFIFADDERESNPASYKLLRMAHAWAQAKKAGTGSTMSSGGIAPTISSSSAENPPERSDMPMEEDDRSDVSSHHAGE